VLLMCQEIAHYYHGPGTACQWMPSWEVFFFSFSFLSQISLSLANQV
jgi:hypothetical protein